jgi:hypothetical protein
LSLQELIKTLLDKKDQCINKKQRVKFIKLALNCIWWILENFTVDLTFEYLQCIQLIRPKNIEEHFDRVVDLLKTLLDKITLDNEI